MKHKIFKYDPKLQAFEADFDLRTENLRIKKESLLAPGQSLSDFANGYEYFGFHPADGGWYYREWAPAAEKLYLTGDFCNWDRYAHPMKALENGVFELFLPGENALPEGSRVMTVVVSGGQELETEHKPPRGE